MSDRYEQPEGADVDAPPPAPVEEPDADGGAPPPGSGDAAGGESEPESEPAQQAAPAEAAQQPEAAAPAQQTVPVETAEPPDADGGAPPPGEKADTSVEAAATQEMGPNEVVEEPDGDGGTPPPAEHVGPEKGVETEPSGGDQAPGGDRHGDVGVVHAYLPPDGSEADPPHAVDGIDYPAYQDDNLGRHAWQDAKAVERGDPPQWRDEADVAELGRLSRDLETAPPPEQTVFRGELRDEADVDGWKDRAEPHAGSDRDGVPLGPTEHLDMRSTSTDGQIALAYAEEPRPGPPPVAADGTELPPAGASQRHGEAPRAGDGVPAFEAPPPDEQLARRIAPEEPVPGYEVSAHALEPGAIAREAEAHPEKAEALARLAATIGDEGQPAAAQSEGARREVMNERIASGDYEMAGLLDTRPGKEFEWGETGVFWVPTHDRSPDGTRLLDSPPPGVYVAWRPRKER